MSIYLNLAIVIGACLYTPYMRSLNFAYFRRAPTKMDI